MFGIYESISALAKKVNRLCCAVKILQENSSAGEVGSPIFQPDIITYSGTTAGGIGIDMGNYSPIVFWSRQILAPNLLTIYGSIFMYGDNSEGNPILNTISMPLLESIGSLTNDPSVSQRYAIFISDFRFLQTIDFSSLKTIEYNSADINSVWGIGIFDLDSLTTLNIGALESVDGAIEIAYNPLLTSLSISNLTTFDGLFSVFGNALNQTTIDAILYQLAIVINLSNQYVDLSGGTNAAPSLTGAGYVATLIANGCTVTTN